MQPSSTSQTQKPHQQPLFGGAISCQLPTSMVDCSQFRELADNEEMYTDVDTGVSVIVHLAEKIDEKLWKDMSIPTLSGELVEVKDREAEGHKVGSFFFEFIAKTSGSSGANVFFLHSETANNSSSASSSPLKDAIDFTASLPTDSQVGLTLNQTIPELVKGATEGKEGKQVQEGEKIQPSPARDNNLLLQAPPVSDRVFTEVATAVFAAAAAGPSSINANSADKDEGDSKTTVNTIIFPQVPSYLAEAAYPGPTGSWSSDILRSVVVGTQTMSKFREGKSNSQKPSSTTTTTTSTINVDETENTVLLVLYVLRLPDPINTDVLIQIYFPLSLGSDSSESNSLKRWYTVEEMRALVKGIQSSFAVLDWTLFVPTTASTS